jgi:hypothetical protein
MHSSQSTPGKARASVPENAVVAGRESGERQWFHRVTRLLRFNASRRGVPDTSAYPLLAFPAETGSRSAPIATPPAGQTPAAKPRSRLLRPIVIGGTVVVLAGLGAFAVRWFPVLPITAEEPRAGTLTIDTRPGEAAVLVDGERRGATPLTISITPGAHTITIRNGFDERVVPLTMAAGGQVTHYFEMRRPEPVIVAGRVSIVTDPPGARVTVDGQPRGISPVIVSDLPPQEHRIVATSDAGSAEQTVTVTAGATTAVMFSLPRVSGPVGGWLAISAPFEVEVVERGDVVGASGTNRIMLAAGRHDIVLRSNSLGYQEAQRIDVVAGQTTTLRVEPPKVSVSVNARPWAEVLLDGTSIGQTPIANLLVTVGPHEMVFRHPQLAERRQTVMVTAKGPNRVAADLTR